MRLKWYVYLLSMSFPYFSMGQELDRTLNVYFTDVRSGQYKPVPKNLFLPQNTKSTLTYLSLYLKDTSAVVRSKAYSIAQLAGSNTLQSAVREDAVTKLIEGVKDKESGNAGIALAYLTGFIFLISMWQPKTR